METPFSQMLGIFYDQFCALHFVSRQIERYHACVSKTSDQKQKFRNVQHLLKEPLERSNMLAAVASTCVCLIGAKKVTSKGSIYRTMFRYFCLIRILYTHQYNVVILSYYSTFLSLGTCLIETRF